MTAIVFGAGAGGQDGVVNSAAAGRIAVRQEQARHPCLPDRASRLRPVVSAGARPPAGRVPGEGPSLRGRRALVAQDLQPDQREDAALPRLLAPGDAVPGVRRVTFVPLVNSGRPQQHHWKLSHDDSHCPCSSVQDRSRMNQKRSIHEISQLTALQGY